MAGVFVIGPVAFCSLATVESIKRSIVNMGHYLQASSWFGRSTILMVSHLQGQLSPCLFLAFLHIKFIYILFSQRDFKHTL